MRRLLVPLIAGCVLLGAAPAHARYGDPIGYSSVDTWLVAGDRVVGRSEIQASPPPTLTMAMAPGGTRVLAWRVGNVAHAETITMSACQSGSGVGVRYFTPKGREVSSLVTHDGYVQKQVEERTFRSLSVHLYARRSNASFSCVLRGFARGGGFDKVILEVTA
jgi:hypothetical protein